MKYAWCLPIEINFHKNMWIYDFLFSVPHIFARGHVRLWKKIKSSVYKSLYKQPTLLL